MVSKKRLKQRLLDGTVERWFKDSLLRFVLELKTKSSLQESLNQFFLNLLKRMLRRTLAYEKEIPSVHGVPL